MANLESFTRRRFIIGLIATAGCSSVLAETIDRALLGEAKHKIVYQLNKADEEYIKNSILNPAGQVVDGFAPSMPTYQGKLNDKQLNGIIEYIKTLK